MIAAVAVLVDPSADRVARVRWLDVPGPVTSVGEDSTIVVIAADQNIGGVRRDDEVQRPRRHHHERHAGGEALGMADEIALTAFGLIRKTVLQDFLILRRQRGLLPESPWLGLVE